MCIISYHYVHRWCGPCVLLAPQLEEAANHYKGRIRFLKVDSDESESLASAMKVRSLFCWVVSVILDFADWSDICIANSPVHRQRAGSQAN